MAASVAPSVLYLICLSCGSKSTLSGMALNSKRLGKYLSTYDGYTVADQSFPAYFVTRGQGFGNLTVSDYVGFDFIGWFTTPTNKTRSEFPKSSDASVLLSRSDSISPDTIYANASYQSADIYDPDIRDGYEKYIVYPKFRKKSAIDAWSNKNISIRIGLVDFKLTDVVVHGKTWYWTNKIFDGTLSAPSTSGAFVFDGWYTLPNDASSIENEDPAYATVLMSRSTSMSVSDVQSKAKKTTYGDYFCYAKYVGKEIIVTYNPNGGLSDRYFDRLNVEGKFPSLPTATRGSETTGRWYTAASGGKEIHRGDTVTQTSDFTLYAHWSIPVNTHTLAFNANGGTVSPVSRTLAEGASYGTLPTPTRSGYTFVEWRTSPYVGTLVTAATTMGTDDVTIYAIWTGNPFTITLNPNGGTVSPTTKSVPNGSTYGILPRPTRSGFIFDGWWTAATGGTKILATAKPSGHQTVYAHWKQDGGEVVPWVF